VDSMNPQAKALSNVNPWNGLCGDIQTLVYANPTQVQGSQPWADAKTLTLHSDSRTPNPDSPLTILLGHKQHLMKPRILGRGPTTPPLFKTLWSRNLCQPAPTQPPGNNFRSNNLQSPQDQLVAPAWHYKGKNENERKQQRNESFKLLHMAQACFANSGRGTRTPNGCTKDPPQMSTETPRQANPLPPTPLTNTEPKASLRNPAATATHLPPTQNLPVQTWNVMGTTTITQKLTDMVADTRPDILILTETKLTSSTQDQTRTKRHLQQRIGDPLQFRSPTKPNASLQGNIQSRISWGLSG